MKPAPGSEGRLRTRVSPTPHPRAQTQWPECARLPTKWCLYPRGHPSTQPLCPSPPGKAYCLVSKAHTRPPWKLAQGRAAPQWTGPKTIPDDAPSPVWPQSEEIRTLFSWEQKIAAASNFPPRASLSEPVSKSARLYAPLPQHTHSSLRRGCYTGRPDSGRRVLPTTVQSHHCSGERALCVWGARPRPLLRPPPRHQPYYKQINQPATPEPDAGPSAQFRRPSPEESAGVRAGIRELGSGYSSPQWNTRFTIGKESRPTHHMGTPCTAPGEAP